MSALHRIKTLCPVALVLLLAGCGEEDQEPACGNGVLETGEECDDGNQGFGDYCLPTCMLARCGDGFLLQGVEQCDDGNDADDDGCTNRCTLPRCGDGIVQTGEACDDGNLDDADDCLSTCVLPLCGDGFVQEGEECDDGNSSDADYCLNDCTLATCGDGFLWLRVEACDDGNSDDQDGCTNRCAPPSCGDGVVQAAEDCDDGNLDNTDDCLNTCLFAHCGDRFWRRDITDSDDPQYEECDDGNQNDHDACLNDCTEAYCGDSILWYGVEQCDDGNLLPDDGCSPLCLRFRCGDGFIQDGEQCDDGNLDNSDGCLVNCTLAHCGDGFVRTGVEQCDDGNLDNSDGCLANCTLATCGDGFLQAGVEPCDDGNFSNADHCLNDCTLATCGDGFVRIGVEQCDDSNRSDTDACLNDCTLARCGDGFVWAGVERCDDGNLDSTDDCLADCTPARCGDGFVRAGVEQCDDANQDNTDTCLANCHQFLWCDGYGITAILPEISCEGHLPSELTLVGSGFYWVDGIGPLVILHRPDGLPPLPLDPTSIQDSCVDLAGLLADVQRCQRMTIPLDSSSLLGNYQVEVLESLAAGCRDIIDFSIGPVPELDSLDPTPVCAGERLLTLYGSGFVSQTIVQLIGEGGSPILEPIATELVSSNELIATFDGLAEGWYDALVSNGDEACTALLEDAIEVVPDPLAVFAEPSVLFNEITIRITVYLSDLSADRINFVGIRKQDSIGPYQPLTYYFDPAEKGEIQADVPAGLDTGIYDLVVIDDALCVAPLYQAFRVTDSDNINLVEIDPPFGWEETRTAVTLLAQDDPEDAVVNTFVSLPTVYLNPTTTGEGTVATRLSAIGFLSSTEITAVVPADLPVGDYTVIVVNPQGSEAEVGVLEGAFQVTQQAPPTIDLVAPSTLPRTPEDQSFTVEGSNFRDPSVTLLCRNRDGEEQDPLPVEVDSDHTENLLVAVFPGSTGSEREGWICIVRLTNGDDGSYGEFSALAIIQSSLNPAGINAEPGLVTPRRALAVTGGKATARAQFIYAMGGEGGSTSVGLTTLNSVEVGHLDRYGYLVPPDETHPELGFRLLREDRWLPEPRSFAMANTVGHFIYLAGGAIDGLPTRSVIRAEILRPEDAPIIRRVRMRVVEATEPAITQPGVYYYRLAAVMPPDDPDNPGGETLASDPQPVRIPALVDDTGEPLYLQVTIRWARQEGDPILYRLYRSPMPAGSTGTERFLAEVTCETVGQDAPCEFTDFGTIDMTGELAEPRRLGDIGVWMEMPSMLHVRQGLGLARGEEPDNDLLPDTFYLYAIAGLGTSNQVRTDYEYLPIFIGTDGSHVVGTAWQPGVIPPGEANAGDPNLLRTSRWMLGAYSVDREVTDRLANPRDNWIYTGCGRRYGPATGQSEVLSKDVDAALVTSGGLLGTWIAVHDANNRAGYGHAALGNQLYMYSGRSEDPSATGDSVLVCETAEGGVECPYLKQWNNASQQLPESLYLLTGGVMSARIFLVGGSNVEGEAVPAVYSLIW
ncbi:MAG: DUF4215 domain-containing protein [Bradymonadales bacterium]|nr:DUF4215 domain-containing protein [Bradymonadales bacterium]